MKLGLMLLIISSFLISCLSPSDKQHSCTCEYDDQSIFVIEGVHNFNDLESGIKCDQECGFKRLLILFYNSSDSSEKMIKLMNSNQSIKNNINDNFAFVCLSTDTSDSNLEFQRKRFDNSNQPFFAVMTSFNDSLITSFGYIDEAEKINSRLTRTLY